MRDSKGSVIKIYKHIRLVELILSVKVCHTDEGTCKGEEEEEDLLWLVTFCKKIWDVMATSGA